MFEKRAMHTSNFEIDSPHHMGSFESKGRTLRILESVRTSLTVMALLCGITILGLSADALAVYKDTHLGADFLLPLWPDNFNLRPTVALVAGSTIVVIANVVGLLFGRVKSLRDTTTSKAMTFAAPASALAASIVAMTYFYVVNASEEVDTVQSWSCRWRDVAMLTRPHFGTLCSQSRAGVNLSVLLVPLELVVLGLALYELGLIRRNNVAGTPSASGFAVTDERRKPGSSGGVISSSGSSTGRGGGSTSPAHGAF